MSETRKIAAILAADVVGFSRMAGAAAALRADLTRPARKMPLCDALAGGAELATTVSGAGLGRPN